MEDGHHALAADAARLAPAADEAAAAATDG